MCSLVPRPSNRPVLIACSSKNWTVGRPGNKATFYERCGMQFHLYISQTVFVTNTNQDVVVYHLNCLVIETITIMVSFAGVW